MSGADYDIEIAFADYANGRASWCGWPPGTVDIDKLTLVEACSDQEHNAAVARWLDTTPSDDFRRSEIRRLHRPVE